MARTMYKTRMMAKALKVFFMTSLSLPTWSTVAQAATVFADNFDADRTGAKRDFDRFLQFTVSDGTVDYMRQGTYKLSCAGGKGGCVDLDGSTLDAGIEDQRGGRDVP